MEPFSLTIKEELGKGLSPNNNPRNRPYLVEAIGAIPYEGVLQAIDQFTRIDSSSLGTLTFPYPQLFVTSNFILVCTDTTIYEYATEMVWDTGSMTWDAGDMAWDLNVFTTKLSGLPTGHTWDLVDFKSFIYMTNGACAVVRDPDTGLYSQSSTLPFGGTLCNYNGQLLIGSPNESGG